MHESIQRSGLHVAGDDQVPADNEIGHHLVCTVWIVGDLIGVSGCLHTAVCRQIETLPDLKRVVCFVHAVEGFGDDHSLKFHRFSADQPEIVEFETDSSTLASLQTLIP